MIDSWLNLLTYICIDAAAVYLFVGQKTSGNPVVIFSVKYYIGGKIFFYNFFNC
jgi:hypothetical protein